MNRRILLVVALLTVGASWALDDAFAQRIEHSRGKILSIDLNRSTVDLSDPQNRVTTWRFRSDAKVKFTDGAPFFPNPSVRDLRPPMYVHYTFTNEVIDSFDVAELGFQPGDPNSGSMSHKQLGVSRTVVGRVSAYDPRVRQVEIQHDGQTETFQLTDRTDQQLEPGTRLQLRTDWSGQHELVSGLRVLTNATQEDSATEGDTTQPRAYGKDSKTAEGRVLKISSRSRAVQMEVAGTSETYTVASSSLLSRLRVGQTVRFDFEPRNGKLVITNIR